jgi:error-prone DNA polymerase
VVESEVECTVIDDETIRLGLNQLSGISKAHVKQMVAQRTVRPWESMDDFLLRCDLSKDERRVLAKAGALNALGHHRRSALWEVEVEREEDLFALARQVRLKPALEQASPLAPMSPVERLEADYDAQSLTVGRHPMCFLRESLTDVKRACDLSRGEHGQRINIAGLVICRQRPGTAKGHVFVSLEDETGIANAFVPSATFEANRLVITQEPFLRIHGRLQKVEGVISVYALRIEALHFERTLGAESHDFH